MIENMAKVRRNSLKEMVAEAMCIDCSRFLIMVVCFGFLFLTVDSFLEHYFTQKGIRPYQWIPIV